MINIEKQLLETRKLIDNSANVPANIKNIVKAICCGYIRESNGKIPIDGIINVCNTKFIEVLPNDLSFKGENRILGETNTSYDKNCTIAHSMSYVNDENYIKLISILTHELGHVLTEFNPCTITENNTFPIVKRTNALYLNCYYENNELMASNHLGFCMSDGFLENISSQIFSSLKFHQELLAYGYDLQDYHYKDERLFPSRIYDEYKSCFVLFDEIMKGKLFDFSCQKYDTNEELMNDINKYKINVIFASIDQSNNALWQLKKYEGKSRNDEFDVLFKDYLSKKDVVLELAHILMEINGTEKTPKIDKLLMDYKNCLKKQSLLPLTLEELNFFDMKEAPSKFY